MEPDRLTRLILVATLAMVGMTGCHEGAETGLDAQLVPIPNATVPMPGVVSGGQPTESQIEAAAERGYRTVINLRTEQEPGFEWERELVETTGMRYVHIPVTGADGLTRENVELLDAALNEARDEGPAGAARDVDRRRRSREGVAVRAQHRPDPARAENARAARPGSTVTLPDR